MRVSKLHWLGICAIATSAIGTLFIAKATSTPSHAQGSNYDWADARQRLERIGAALQLYREAHGVLPVALRKNAADAGLPPSIWSLAKQGHRWSTSPSDFRVPHTRMRWPATALNHFVSVYKETKVRLSEAEEQVVWSRRGEDLPILCDWNPYSSTEMVEGAPTKTVLILRLNGSVDTIQFRPLDVRELLLEK